MRAFRLTAAVAMTFTLSGFVNPTLAAQQPGGTPLRVTRLYTGPDGQTQADEINVKLEQSPGAPGGVERSEVNVTRLQFLRWPPGVVNDWHPAPARQYVITLSGRGEVELASGKKILLEPGRVLLAEDVSGKGHITRTLGTEVWIRITIPLADQ
jgi:quercetin dioxygenase-like cupin family protein